MPFIDCCTWSSADCSPVARTLWRVRKSCVSRPSHLPGFLSALEAEDGPLGPSRPVERDPHMLTPTYGGIASESARGDAARRKSSVEPTYVTKHISRKRWEERSRLFRSEETPDLIPIAATRPRSTATLQSSKALGHHRVWSGRKSHRHFWLQSSHQCCCLIDEARVECRADFVLKPISGLKTSPLRCYCDFRVGGRV
jgi:hypothetical protein